MACSSAFGERDGRSALILVTLAGNASDAEAHVQPLYDLDELESNVESFAREGAIATSAAVRRLARPKQVQ